MRQLGLISVILTVYNAQPFLDRCIQSILNQSYKEIELIIIDDGSTDNSYSICTTYRLQDSRVKLFHQANMGVSCARNRGIKEAKGEYLAFVDSDDYLHPRMYECLLYNLIHYQADISLCNYRRFTDSVKKTVSRKAPSKKHATKTYTLSPYTASVYLYGKRHEEIVVVWNKLYKASLFEAIVFPSRKVYEDEHIIHKLLASSKRLVYSSASLYYYNQNLNSITHRVSHQRLDRLAALEARLRFYERHLSKTLLYYAYMRLITDLMRTSYYVLIRLQDHSSYWYVNKKFIYYYHKKDIYLKDLRKESNKIPHHNLRLWLFRIHFFLLKLLKRKELKSL